MTSRKKGLASKKWEREERKLWSGYSFDRGESKIESVDGERRCWRGGQGSACGDFFPTRRRSLNPSKGQWEAGRSRIRFSLHKVHRGSSK